MSNLTAVSLFAGVGGFDLALTRAGVKVVAAVEINEKCREVLGKHFPESKLFDDVKGVTGEQLRAAGFIPERGIITAGFPCQDLSIAGLRRGLAGERSGLFWEIVRLIDETQTETIILENVPGLLSSQRGKDMGIIITALVERGYGVCWRVLDSQNFGVPQRRRRVFIVASRGNHRRPVEVLFERNSGFWDFETSGKGSQEFTAEIKGNIDQDSNELNYFIFQCNRSEDTRIYPTVSPTLGCYVGSIPFAFNSNNNIVRRLTPIEYERLQGFPDDWTDLHANSHRYKMLGNAVSVPVVEWIIQRMVKLISE